jgi:hypothetical protein
VLDIIVARSAQIYQANPEARFTITHTDPVTGLPYELAAEHDFGFARLRKQGHTWAVDPDYTVNLTFPYSRVVSGINTSDTQTLDGLLTGTNTFHGGADLKVTPGKTLVVDGSVTFTSSSGNVSVPSGATLEARPGASFTFTGGTGIWSSGRVRMVGTASKRVTLRRAPGSGYYNYLYLNGSGTNGSELRYVDISGMRYGVHTNAVSGLTLQHLRGYDNYYGSLKLYNAVATLSNSEFYSNYYHGAFLQGGTYYLKDNTFRNNGHSGLVFGRGGIGTTLGTGFHASDRSRYVDNAYFGVNVYLGSRLVLGDRFGGTIDDAFWGGGAALHGNVAGQIRAEAATVEADMLYWGSSAGPGGAHNPFTLETYSGYAAPQINTDCHLNQPHTLAGSNCLPSSGPGCSPGDLVCIPEPFSKGGALTSDGALDSDSTQVDSLAAPPPTFWDRHFARSGAPDVDSLFVLLYDTTAAYNRDLAARELLRHFAHSEPQRVADIALRARSGNFADVIGAHLGEAFGAHPVDSLAAYARSGDAGSFFRSLFDEALAAGEPSHAAYALSALHYFEDEDEASGLLSALYADAFAETSGKGGAAAHVDLGLFASDAQEAPGTLEARVHPNPVSSWLTLDYGLPSGARVTVEVYDAIGRRVLHADEGAREAGVYQTRLDAQGLPSGVYLYRVHAGGTSQTGSFVVAR